jgi:hypothetical protein
LYHFDDLAIAVFFLLVYLSLSDQFVAKQVDDDLFLDVRPSSKKVLLGGGGIGEGWLALGAVVVW